MAIFQKYSRIFFVFFRKNPCIFHIKTHVKNIYRFLFCQQQNGNQMTSQNTLNDVKRLASVLDATLLDENAQKEQIVALCQTAKDANAASVCVLPKWVLI